MPAPSSLLPTLLADLAATQAHLHAVLVTLDPEDWDRPTPSPGWTVRHQVRHLAHGEELGRLAVVDPTAFGAELARMLADLAAVEATTTATTATATATDETAGETAAELVDRWFAAATGLREAVEAGPADERIGWVTGPMSRGSFLTARVMETFAHGHDIGAAVGRHVPDALALEHVAHLGVATRGFAYANRGLPVPDSALRVELTGLTDAPWVLGPDDAADVVRGPARDLCLVVTQRIHRDDTALVATGPHAEEWLAIAQCFAGPPSHGPHPHGPRSSAV